MLLHLCPKGQLPVVIQLRQGWVRYWAALGISPFLSNSWSLLKRSSSHPWA